MADLRTCSNGHYYDPDMYSSCPYCANLSGAVDRSVPAGGFGGNQDMGAGSDTAPLAGSGKFSNIGETVPAGVGNTVRPLDDTTPAGIIGGATYPPVNNPVGGDDTKTTIVQPDRDIRKKAYEDVPPVPGYVPPTEPAKRDTYSFVVGWLVATKGPYEGRSFEVHHGNTTIGRTIGDILLTLDSSITGDRHAEITYDVRHCRYFLVARNARNNIYVDDNIVINGSNVELKPYSEVDLGDSSFRFVPFCTDAFKW